MSIKSVIYKSIAVLCFLSFSNVAVAGLSTDADDMYDFLYASGGYIQAGTTGQYERVANSTGSGVLFNAGDIVSAVSHFTIKTAADGGSPQSSITPANGTTAALVWLAELSGSLQTGGVQNVALASIADGTTAVTANTGGFASRLSNLSGDADFNGSAFAMLLVSPSTANGGVDLTTLTSISAINTAALSGGINVAAAYTLDGTADSLSYTYSSSGTNNMSFTFGLTGTVDSDLVGDSRFAFNNTASLRTGSFNVTLGIDGYDATAASAANYNLLSGSKTHFTIDGVAVLPEPSSLAVLSGVFFGVFGSRRRKRAS